MTVVHPLSPADYLRMPWKNGKGILVVIDRAGEKSWENMGVAWHFGRTSIIEEGPFSDYSGYERLQVVIFGSGLVLVAGNHEIDLREPLRVQRYDGGLPVRTRLENGPVEVVNLIADRRRFSIHLVVGYAGAATQLGEGTHIAYAPSGLAKLTVSGEPHGVDQDHALRIVADGSAEVRVDEGTILLASIAARR